MRLLFVTMAAAAAISRSASANHSLLQTKADNMVVPNPSSTVNKESDTKDTAKPELTSKAAQQPNPSSTVNKESDTKDTAKAELTSKTGSNDGDKDRRESASKNKTDANAIRTTGPGAEADLDEKGYQAVAKLKKNIEMETFIKRLVKNMSLEVVDTARLKGVVPFYSGVKTKQSFANLKKEITSLKDNPCESWVMEDKPTTSVTGFTAPLNEEGYLAVARKHNDSEMEKFIEREIVDLNYEITDVSGLLGLSPFHSCAKGTKSFETLQQELMTLAATPGKWVRLKGTKSAARAAGPQPHSADSTLKKEEEAKDLAEKRAALSRERQIKQTVAKAMEAAKAKSSLLQNDADTLSREQKMQQEMVMMKAAREAYDKKVEQEMAIEQLLS